MMEDSIFEVRRKSLRKTLESGDLQAVLIPGLENIRYLCGFTGSDGALVLTPGECHFLTDSRYWTQSEIEVRGAQIVRYKKKLDGISTLLRDLNLKRIGFESAALPYALYQKLSERLKGGMELVPLEDEFTNLRAVKDDHELASIRKAIEIASKGFEHILGRLKPGAIERDMALEMEFFTKEQGSEGLGFDIIIASGKRSALPHGKASDKKIEKGDLIVIDFGSMFQGYYSDQTRTVMCGKPSSEQKKIYQVVKDAQAKAIEAVRPGIPIRQIDAGARDHIRDSGYGDYFGHGTGPGIGLAVHEDPAVNQENEKIVQEGMVMTIEPGIYIPELGGVRIEDMVRVTGNGAEVLSYLPKELQIVLK